VEHQNPRGGARFYQTAAGPPASKPRKKPALSAVLFPDSDTRRVLSWFRVPNTADKVHCDKTRGKTFDEVPATVELLQMVDYDGFERVL